MNEPRITIRDTQPVVPYSAFPDGSLVAFNTPREGFATVVNRCTGELGVFRFEMKPPDANGNRIATIWPLEEEPSPPPVCDPVKVLDEQLPVSRFSRFLAFLLLICLPFRLLLRRRVHLIP